MAPHDPEDLWLWQCDDNAELWEWTPQVADEDASVALWDWRASVDLRGLDVPCADDGAEPAPATLDPRKFIGVTLRERVEVSPDTRIFRLALPTPSHVLGLPVGKHLSEPLPSLQPRI